MDAEYTVWIGDQLPTIYEVAQTIFFYAKRKDTELRARTITRYVAALETMWIKSFGEKHVVTTKCIRNRVEKIMLDYENRVRASHSKSSLRVRNRNWMSMDIPQPKRGKKLPEKTNSDLFDIGKDTQSLEGREKIFYDDQRGERRHLLSQEIDLEYENEKLLKMEAAIAEEEQQKAELDFINEESEIISPSSSRRSRSKHDEEEIVSVDKECQTDPALLGAPDIRKVRNFTYEIKDTISTVSSKAAVSVNKARVATQVVCAKLYNHQYKLEAPALSTADPPQSKKPRRAEDYKRYEKVLPSEKTINIFKHKKALSQEIVAANALINKSSSTKVTLHFDTTSRSRIDGDWPCLILNFLDDDKSKCNMISLRPLFFAFEDRNQIVSLIVETLHRLSAATDSKFTAAQMWERIDALMTDSVSKNLNINEGVAERLGSEHIPYSVLCKAHTCERLDADNITTLSKIEAKIGLRELIGKREPLLKSFLRKHKSVVVAALEALLKLVATEGDGKTTSLREEFDLKLEEHGVHKSLSLYKEKRFTKLGYQAGAVYDCIPYFLEILKETPHNNLLVRSCKIYLESDFISAGLKALANFTYRVTMPFLNFMERSDQNMLVEKLPRFYKDLSEKRMDTFDSYHVEWTHVKMADNCPVTKLDKFILDEMCLDAAVGVKLQCKREYWNDGSDTVRATVMNELTSTERKNLPPHNLSAERYLGKFGYLASQSALHSNRQFTAKRIKDDLVLSDENNVVIDKSLNSVLKHLDQMEITWAEKQKEMKKCKIKENLAKKLRANEFVDHLLIKCKEHNGPVTSVRELKELVSQKSPEVKTFLRQEIQYQRVTHERDAEARKELYKVNKLSVEEMAENLTVILSEDVEREGAVVFPCEDEVMEIINGEVISSADEGASSKEPAFESNQPLAVLWDERATKKWYIGFFIDFNEDGSFRVDHLKRSCTGDKFWVRPAGEDDIQDVVEEQVVPIDVSGDWDFTKDIPRYVVFNHVVIQDTFKQIM